MKKLNDITLIHITSALSIVALFVFNSIPAALVFIANHAAYCFFRFKAQSEEYEQKRSLLKEDQSQIQQQIAELKSKVDALILGKGFR